MFEFKYVIWWKEEIKKIRACVQTSTTRLHAPTSAFIFRQAHYNLFLETRRINLWRHKNGVWNIRFLRSTHIHTRACAHTHTHILYIYIYIYIPYLDIVKGITKWKNHLCRYSRIVKTQDLHRWISCVYVCAYVCVRVCVKRGETAGDIRRRESDMWKCFYMDRQTDRQTGKEKKRT